MLKGAQKYVNRFELGFKCFFEIFRLRQSLRKKLVHVCHCYAPRFDKEVTTHIYKQPFNVFTDSIQYNNLFYNKYSTFQAGIFNY